MTGKRRHRSPISSPLPDSPRGGPSKDQEKLLPIANVNRIMKKSLPANAKISMEAKETVQECVSEFISFITGEASDKCQREKRKTINGDDLLWAMTTLGFEDYVGPLKVYLNQYREMEGEKTPSVTSQGDQSFMDELKSCCINHGAIVFAEPTAKNPVYTENSTSLGVGGRKDLGQMNDFHVGRVHENGGRSAAIHPHGV